MADIANQFLKIKLSNEVVSLGRESNEWVDVSKRVREAFETHGIFMVDYEKISIELQNKVFEMVNDLFNLPLEMKQLYTKPMHAGGGYQGSNAFIPFFESFGIVGPQEFEVFEKTFWSEGNIEFRKVFDSLNASMSELCLVLSRMIFDSLGLKEYFEEKAMMDNLNYDIRIIKYRATGSADDSIGLQAHVDKSLITILFPSSVQGLQALSKEGNWIYPHISQGSLVVIAGDALQVMSNGRIQGLKHRVVLNGTKQRYSCGFFFLPNKGVTIEVPPGLIDGDHPPRYRPFVYSEYRDKYISNINFDVLENYASIN